jgi:two-component system chemotaxis response regulator CheB
MIVDDSAVVRGMVSRWLEDEDVEIAAMAVDGVQALKKLADTDIDVCILDIEMPNMSGLEALPKLLAMRPGLRVIMASTLSERGAEVTLRALDMGAVDYIPKPSANRLGGAETYRRDLLQKVLQLGARVVQPVIPQPTIPPSPTRSLKAVQAMVVASSTGGPPALRQFLASLGAGWTAPILIAQHMPAGFTRSLAQMLDRSSPLSAREAVAGEPIHPRTIYVAPGGSHMSVRTVGAGVPAIHLDQGPEINWCRPSADPLFASAARLWGASTIGVVLTGMGHDGRDGAIALAGAGGIIVAQDEATSVVWGMPGAVAQAGVTDAVLPLAEIGPFVSRLAMGGAR